MRFQKPQIVIVGGGFGGLTAAKKLRKAQADVILIDKTNHHLFQPLLYQVATSALSPGDIAVPLRSALHKYRNIQVVMGEVTRIDKENMRVFLENEFISFDNLILAPGSRHSYFGNDAWEEYAPGLKCLKDALNIRERILLSFEKAVRVYGTPEARKYLTFVIVGGGPTGVEMAGSIAEIAMKTMLPDFPILKYGDIRVILVDSGAKILSSFSGQLSDYSFKALNKLGVEVMNMTKVIEVNASGIKTAKGIIESANVLWAAGNTASGLTKQLGVELDDIGRVIVQPDLSVPGSPNIFVIGDSARVINPDGSVVPGVAPAAIQEAAYVAGLIIERQPAGSAKPFLYKDKGNLATIGMAKAIAQFGKFEFKGLLAWILWTTLHILFLINYRNKLRVFTEWCWYYLTKQPGARLIVHKELKK